MEEIIDVTVQKFNTQIFRADYSRDADEEEKTGEGVTANLQGSVAKLAE